jgi:hypothetical protein
MGCMVLLTSTDVSGITKDKISMHGLLRKNTKELPKKLSLTKARNGQDNSGKSLSAAPSDVY